MHMPGSINIMASNWPIPEIPPLDPMKVTQRPNMRRLNLIQIDELDFTERRSTVLGQGAFGTVFAVRNTNDTVRWHQRIPGQMAASGC